MGFEDIYLWKNPFCSGPIFGTVLLVLLSICYYSLISVVAYTALFVLGTMAGIKLYVYVMNNFLKKNVNDPLQKYASFDPTVSDEKIHSIVSNVSGKVNCTVLELRRMFLIENMIESVKFGMALWFLTYIGSWFNAMTLLILSWVGLFTVPKVRFRRVTSGSYTCSSFLCSRSQIYLNNKEALDPILDKIKVQLDDIKSKVGAVMPAGKATATEAKKEE